MAKDATGANATRRDGQPLYRVAPGGWEPHECVVVTGTPDDPGPAMLCGSKTEKAAREEADTLNGLELGQGSAGKVLGRMMGA